MPSYALCKSKGALWILGPYQETNTADVHSHAANACAHISAYR